MYQKKTIVKGPQVEDVQLGVSQAPVPVESDHFHNDANKTKANLTMPTTKNDTESKAIGPSLGF